MARRPNGHGALYRDKHRPSAPWTLVKAITLADGTSKTVKVRGRTQIEAVAKMEAKEKELAVSISTSTLSEFMTDWLRAKKPLIRASTYRGYEQDLRLYIDPYLGLKRLDRVNPRDIQGMVSKIAEQQKFTTADRVRRTVKHALNQAASWGLIQRNPAEHVAAVKKPTPRRGSWGIDQGDRFLGKLSDHAPEWLALFVLALATGMRKGELLALRWEDLRDGRVFVTRSYTPYGEERFVEPKTKAGIRAIPITPSTSAVLAEHRDLVPPGELVFPGRNGPMNPKRPNVILKQYATLARVPQIRFHDLRRTFTSWMIGGGKDPKTVQWMLGQATPGFAMQIYADAMKAQQEDAALELELVKRRWAHTKAA